MSSCDEVQALVERLARRLPGVPRLTILEAVMAEWDRLRAAAEPWIAPLVEPAAAWRLRHCLDCPA